MAEFYRPKKINKNSSLVLKYNMYIYIGALTKEDQREVRSSRFFAMFVYYGIIL